MRLFHLAIDVLMILYHRPFDETTVDMAISSVRGYFNGEEPGREQKLIYGLISCFAVFFHHSSSYCCPELINKHDKAIETIKENEGLIISHNQSIKIMKEDILRLSNTEVHDLEGRTKRKIEKMTSLHYVGKKERDQIWEHWRRKIAASEEGSDGSCCILSGFVFV